LNNFFTDEAGNLFDGDGNLVAYAGQRQADDAGNIFLNQENQTEDFSQQEEYPQNNQFQNENFSQNQENFLPQKEQKNFFNDLIKDISKLFGGKKIESHHEQGISEKKDNIQFKDKFDSELTPTEDLKRFAGNIANISKFFHKKQGFAKNEARWKLFFIGKKEVVGFLDQISTLLDSGIRLVDAIVIMQKQAKSKSMEILMRSLAKKMGNGMHLSEAFKDYEYIFPEKWVHMIKAAEKSGKMTDVLKDLAKEEMAQMQFIAKIKGAMIYPGILIGMALLVFWGMMKYMVPALEKSFGSVDKLPALTQKIIEISHFMQDHTITLFLYPIAFFGIYFFLKSQFITIQKIVDWFALRMPIFGDISKMKNIVMFADNLTLMLSSGVVIADSLKIVAETMPSILYQKEVHKIRRGINDGKTMSEMLGLSGKMDDDNVKENFFFSLEIAQMVKIGEQTGNTLGVLKKISEVNTNKLDNIVRNLTSMLEPLITVIIGGMVGTLIVAFMIPMMSSFKNVG
ncbi:type II secretion system F family protein, partial [Candidatus Gracilibacteria bacterium]|nr:type II secretion system F family protein [Candidatus Gracilibacteria bacterium]